MTHEQMQKNAIEKAFKWVTKRYDLNWAMEDITNGRYKPQTMHHYFKLCIPDNSGEIPRRRKYDIDFHFSRNARFGKFSYNGPKSKDMYNLKIRIEHTRDAWLSYKKKTVGRYARVRNIDRQISYEIELVHELTHLVQAYFEEPFSEVETTENEMQYVKFHYPEIFEQTKSLEDERKNNKGRPPKYKDKKEPSPMEKRFMLP